MFGAARFVLRALHYAICFDVGHELGKHGLKGCVPGASVARQYWYFGALRVAGACILLGFSRPALNRFPHRMN
jgi:hypothetical protein